MEPRTTPLGIELETQRKEQGLSIRQLADMINRNRAYLSQIELGYVTPGPKILEEIAGALDINRNLLLRHINLFKMEFTRPAVHEEGKDPLAGLTQQEVGEVFDYIDYIKYKREIEASGSPPKAKAGIKHPDFE